MATIVPQKTDFDIAAQYNKQLNRCTQIAAIFSVMSAALSFSSLYSCLEGWITVLSVILIFAVLFLQIRFRSAYRKAESVRRDSLVDNCFGTVIAEVQAEGYYDNSNVDIGCQKLLAAVHESCSLSLDIINQMLSKLEYSTIVGCIIVIIAGAISSIRSALFLAILNGFLALNYINDYSELRFLKTELQTICDNCKHVCEDFSETRRKTFTPKQQAHVIRECIRYETALSYASTMLDERIYIKLNPEHEKKWDALKQRYYTTSR